MSSNSHSFEWKKNEKEVAKILSRTLNELKRTKWTQERLLQQIEQLQNKRLQEKEELLARQTELTSALSKMLTLLKKSELEMPTDILDVKALLQDEDDDLGTCRCMP